MLKRTIQIILILSIAYFLQSFVTINTNEIIENKGNDLAKDLLKGRVKSMNNYCYVAVYLDGKIIKGGRYRYPHLGSDYITKYNIDGNTEEYTYYASNDTLKGQTCCEYNINGKLVQVLDYDSEYQLFSKKIYKYDAQSNLIEESYLQGKKLLKQIKYKYSKRGKLIEEVFKDQFSNGKTKYVYDAKTDLKIEEHYYNRKDSLYSKAKFTYNDNNILLEKAVYQYGKHYKGDVYTYDENENLIKHFDFSKNSTIGYEHTNTYKYNEKNQKIEKKLVSANELRNHIIYEYDDAGNVIKEEIIVDRGSKDITRKTLISYDNHGNWLTKTYFENQLPYYILEREIEYYK
ncbi:hypothetical protein [Flammeovirga pacifica]|uniref:Sugar-binding protein n=1 Tax=Flammeovirga pacifica TaxID=915059 RepID=A0A1S1YSC3_FLAPC|nr:hypothetical protein [Flammeovirga pacifica]OHX63932.1 hypothetical protein NH26_20185 [Flammeovirga pacifica]